MLQMCSNCCFFGLWYGDFSTFRVLHSFAFAAFRLVGFFAQNLDFFNNFLTFRFSSFRAQFGILHTSAPTAVRKHSFAPLAALTWCKPCGRPTPPTSLPMPRFGRAWQKCRPEVLARCRQRPTLSVRCLRRAHDELGNGPSCHFLRCCNPLPYKERLGPQNPQP